MKRLLYVLVGAVAFSLNVMSENPAPVKVRVLKYNVNIRAKPNMVSEVVGQVSTNDELVVKSMSEEWVEIVPPSSVNLWVLSDYIQDNVVNGQNVNVRAGAGINFSIVGQVNRGVNVVVTGSHLDWVSIVPPEACSLWVYRPLVEVVSDEKDVPPATVESAEAEAAGAEQERFELEREPESYKRKSVVQGDRTTNVFAVTVEAATDTAGMFSIVKPPRGLDLIPSHQQGQWKQVEGVLRSRAHFFRVPSKYRLVTYDSDQKAITICYVKGNNAQLKALLNRHLLISGREYWVRKMQYPVIVPERIVLK